MTNMTKREQKLHDLKMKRARLTLDIAHQDAIKEDKKRARKAALGASQGRERTSGGKRAYHQFRVSLDVVLAVFCLFSVVMSPLAIVLFWLAWLRYDKHIKAGA